MVVKSEDEKKRTDALRREEKVAVTTQFWRFVCKLRCLSLSLQCLFMGGSIWNGYQAGVGFDNKEVLDLPLLFVGFWIECMILPCFFIFGSHYCQNARFRHVGKYALWICCECILLIVLFVGFFVVLWWMIDSGTTTVLVSRGVLFLILEFQCVVGFWSIRWQTNAYEKKRANELYTKYGLARIRPWWDVVIFGFE